MSAAQKQEALSALREAINARPRIAGDIRESVRQSRARRRALGLLDRFDAAEFNAGAFEYAQAGKGTDSRRDIAKMLQSYFGRVYEIHRHEQRRIKRQSAKDCLNASYAHHSELTPANPIIVPDSRSL